MKKITVWCTTFYLFLFLSGTLFAQDKKTKTIEDKIRYRVEKAIEYLQDSGGDACVPPGYYNFFRFLREPGRQLNKIPYNFKKSIEAGEIFIVTDHRCPVCILDHLSIVFLYNYLTDKMKQKLRQDILKFTPSEEINGRIREGIKFFERYNSGNYSLWDDPPGFLFALIMLDIPIPDNSELKESAGSFYKKVLEKEIFPVLKIPPFDKSSFKKSTFEIACAFINLLICSRILSIDVKKEEWYQKLIPWFKQQLKPYVIEDTPEATCMDDRGDVHLLIDVRSLMFELANLRCAEELGKKLGLDFDFREHRIMIFKQLEEKGVFHRSGVLGCKHWGGSHCWGGVSTHSFVVAFCDWYPAVKKQKEKQKKEDKAIETGRRK